MMEFGSRRYELIPTTQLWAWPVEVGSDERLGVLARTKGCAGLCVHPRELQIVPVFQVLVEHDDGVLHLLGQFPAFVVADQHNSNGVPVVTLGVVRSPRHIVQLIYYTIISNSEVVRYCRPFADLGVEMGDTLDRLSACGAVVEYDPFYLALWASGVGHIGSVWQLPA